MILKLLLGVVATAVLAASAAAEPPTVAQALVVSAALRPANDPYGRDDLELALMRADGTGFHPLTRNTIGDVDPAWSPDGRTIAFARLRSAYAPTHTKIDGIYALTLADHVVRRLTHGDDRGPTYSRDGRTLAFVRVSRFGSVGASGTLMLMAARGGRPRPVAAVGRSIHVAWAAGGRALFWGDGSAIYRVDIRTGYFTHLVIDGHPTHPIVSPDGTKIAYSNYLDGPGIYEHLDGGVWIANVDGSDPRLVLPQDHFLPASWSGQRLLAYYAGTLLGVPLAGGQPETLLPEDRSLGVAGADFRPPR